MEELSPPKPAKRKVMIYVPEDVCRAMGILAVERDCSVSDLYVEAASALLGAGQSDAQTSARAGGVPEAAGVASPLDGVLSEILQRLEDLKQGQATAAALDTGQTMARAMAVALSTLARAGADGITRYALLGILNYEGFPDEVGPGLIARLREYGLVAGKHTKLTLRTPSDAGNLPLR